MPGASANPSPYLLVLTRHRPRHSCALHHVHKHNRGLQSAKRSAALGLSMGVHQPPVKPGRPAGMKPTSMMPLLPKSPMACVHADQRQAHSPCWYSQHKPACPAGNIWPRTGASCVACRTMASWQICWTLTATMRANTVRAVRWQGVCIPERPKQ